jgi:hypothetical protein
MIYRLFGVDVGRGYATCRNCDGGDYFDRPKSAVDLPTEIQSSWGMVLVDPHWDRVQVYEPSLPLWPTTLQPGWQTRINAKYKSSETGSALPWTQTMKAEAGVPSFLLPKVTVGFADNHRAGGGFS